MAVTWRGVRLGAIIIPSAPGGLARPFRIPGNPGLSNKETTMFNAQSPQANNSTTELGKQKEMNYDNENRSRLAR